MAAISVVGSMGETEINRDVFLSAAAPTEEWKGNQAYACAHFVELPVGSSSNDLVMTLPREIKEYSRPNFAEQSVDEIFQLEKT